MRLIFSSALSTIAVYGAANQPHIPSTSSHNNKQHVSKSALLETKNAARFRNKKRVTSSENEEEEGDDEDEDSNEKQHQNYDEENYDDGEDDTSPNSPDDENTDKYSHGTRVLSKKNKSLVRREAQGEGDDEEDEGDENNNAAGENQNNESVAEMDPEFDDESRFRGGSTKTADKYDRDPDFAQDDEDENGDEDEIEPPSKKHSQKRHQRNRPQGSEMQNLSARIGQSSKQKSHHKHQNTMSEDDNEENDDDEDEDSVRKAKKQADEEEELAEKYGDAGDSSVPLDKQIGAIISSIN